MTSLHQVLQEMHKKVEFGFERRKRRVDKQRLSPESCERTRRSCMTWSGRRSRVERTVVTRLLDVSCRNVSLPSSLFSLSSFCAKLFQRSYNCHFLHNRSSLFKSLNFPHFYSCKTCHHFPNGKRSQSKIIPCISQCKTSKVLVAKITWFTIDRKESCARFLKKSEEVFSRLGERCSSRREFFLSSLHFETTREGAAEKKTSTTTKKISLQRREREKPLWLRKEEEGKREEWREELKERRERGKHLSFVAFSSDSSSTAHVCLFSRDHRCRWSPFPVWFTSSTHPESYQLSSWILEASNPTRMARVAKAVGAGGELQFDMSLPSSHALHFHTNCISLTLDVHPL